MDSAEVLDSLDHPVFISNASQSLVYINESARRTLGLPLSASVTLQDVLNKLATFSGEQVHPDKLNGETQIKVSWDANQQHHIDAMLKTKVNRPGI